MAFSLNDNIPLLATASDPFAEIQEGFQFGEHVRQAPLRNQILRQSAQQGQQEIEAEQVRSAQVEQDRVITSVATGAMELLPMIESGDFKGLEKNLVARIELLNSQGRDTKLSEQALAAVVSGDASQIQQVKKIAQSAVDIAESRDLITTTGGKDRFSPTTTSLPGGITVQTTSKGRKRVTDAGGKVLKGQDAVEAIRVAEELKAQRQVDIAGGKREAVLKKDIELGGEAAATTDAAKAAIKVSTDTFNRLEPLRTNIANIDDAISLIDQGAKTGVIASRLPSIRSASIKLDTIQKKLGLDVISSTTFGALSEGEREFALSSALPTTLKGPALKQWLIEKKAVQEKLINQLSEAATFLGTPGNTIADYIELKTIETAEQQAQAATANQGMVDNNDGTFTLPDGRIVRRK